MDEKEAQTDGIAPIADEESKSQDNLDEKKATELYEAIEILKKQAGKIDSYTGRILEPNSSFDNIELSGALFQIIDFVKGILPRKSYLRRLRKARLEYKTQTVETRLTRSARERTNNTPRSRLRG